MQNDKKILLQTRCTEGRLILYENNVAVELKAPFLGTIKSNSIAYSQITGCDVQLKVSPLMLGSTIKIYSEGRQEIVAKLVKPKDAEIAKEIILSKITHR